HWHHPDLVEMLQASAPENQLWELIEQKYVAQFATKIPWRGSAMQLHQELTEPDFKFAYAAKKLISSAQMCGTYLSRLETRHPSRISSVNNHNSKLWTIRP